MFKRIILGVVLVAVVGGLVYGAINRTNAKAGRETAAVGGRRNGQVEREAEQITPQGEQSGGGRGLRGLGRNAGAQGEGPDIGQAVVDEWVTVAGTVASADAETLTVQTSEGMVIEVAGRSWRYAQEQGLALQAGDKVTFIGFYESGDLEVGRITNEGTGQTVSLRDASGRPLWAGRNNRG